MMNIFNRENRYIVIKKRDVDNSLTFLEKQILHMICNKIDNYRINIMGKDVLQCVVVEKDWPEYEKVWDMIEDRVCQR